MQQTNNFKINISGPVFTSIIHESPSHSNGENVYGFLYGNYRTKRNISMTDCTEDDISFEHKVTISRYVCSNFQRPVHSKDDNTSQNENFSCVGMFVIKNDDTKLYPSFRDISALSGVTTTPANSLHGPFSRPLLLVMLSVPRAEQQKASDSADWIYNIKHTCFTYVSGSDPRCSDAVLSTTTLEIPSLAPDLKGEFASVACLEPGRSTDTGWQYNNSGEGSNDDEEVLSQQVEGMAVAGLSQVVETENVTASVVNSMKAELSAVISLEKEVEALRRRVVSQRKREVL